MTNDSKQGKLAGDALFDAFVYLVGFFALLLVLYPLYFVVIASFSDPIAVSAGQVWLIPKDVTMQGYTEIFKDARIWTGYRNTVLYTVLGTFINLLFTIPAAYALSRKDLLIRNQIMFFFIFTMFFSGGLVPTYLTVQKAGMVNTVWAMVLPFCVNVYNLIIARTFFQSSIPGELYDAASIDGCTNTRFFLLIVLPLSKAILAVIGLYYAVGHWNEYFRALIYLKSKNLIPLQLVLRDILVQNQVFQQMSMGDDVAQRLADMIKYGIIIVSTIPILILYPFLQKYFVKGVMIGAVKQ